MKLKDGLLKQQQKEFEENLSFAEWLDYFSKEPTEKELNEMDKSFNKRKVHSQNNPLYQPLQGA